MPHEYRQIVQSTCKWCGKPIEGTKRLKYCKPPKDRTASPCKIAADAKARAARDKKITELEVKLRPLLRVKKEGHRWREE